MPDAQDYRDFFGLLARPETWTAQDRRVAERALVQQRELLAACHPLDSKRRATLASIVERIEGALLGESPE